LEYCSLKKFFKVVVNNWNYNDKTLIFIDFGRNNFFLYNPLALFAYALSKKP